MKKNFKHNHAFSGKCSRHSQDFKRENDCVCCSSELVHNLINNVFRVRSLRKGRAYIMFHF